MREYVGNFTFEKVDMSTDERDRMVVKERTTTSESFVRDAT